MPSINKAIIMGYLGKDPEVQTFPNGGQVTKFTVATSETWKDKTTGENKERTEWHNIQVSHPLYSKWAEELKKGDLVYIEGQIETRDYDKDGVKQYARNINVKQGGDFKSLASRENVPQNRAQSLTDAVYKPVPVEDDFDSEVPF